MAENETYYATYCQLENTSGDSYIKVDGNTLVIGAELAFTSQLHVTERGKEVKRIVLSRGEMAMGFLPDKVYKRVAKFLDDGWTCRAFTSAAIFNKSEVAVICYAPGKGDAFDTFVSSIAKRIAKGEHPAVALSSKEVERVIETDGQWAATKSQKLPKLAKGSAYYKTKRTMTENMAYAAAEGNKGCYVGLFVVIFIIIFSIIWFIFLR